ncbi:MAG: polysaccharide biosynthesis protein [Holosporaceae bacterium]|nr:polysaccharide biosynthesis protein [Holosporaceae bacterium]
MHNSCLVSLLAIFPMILLQFVLLGGLQDKKLFRDAIPVYVVCENENDLDCIKNFLKKYKVFKYIVVSSQSPEKQGLNSFQSIDAVRKWLKKINRIAFSPVPRRLLYFASKINYDTLINLMGLSSEFSIPLFRITLHASNSSSASGTLGEEGTLSPVDISDFDAVTLTSQEKSALSTVLSGKTVWIHYDGRYSVLDLAFAIGSLPSIDMTLLCENERLMADAELELKNKSPNQNYKIKIVDLEMMNACSSKPDILFYNMPVKFANCCDGILKEAVIKNVIGIHKLIEFANQTSIPYVFLLSSSGAMNANNWIGATQRLGELLAQFADSRSRKFHTKFRVIRIPTSATEKFGILGKIMASIKANGCINIDFPVSDVKKMYYRKDILALLIKMVVFALKEYDFSSAVYTLIPKNSISLEDLLNAVCHQFCLRKDADVKIINDCESETMDLEDFPNITEPLEKTPINGIMRTKFSNHNPASYETAPWSIAQIDAMKTRELISVVFQSLNEKITK